MPSVFIKKGTVEFKMDRKDVISCDEKSDGITFFLKGKLYISLEDHDMPASTKQFIVQSLNNFPTADVTIDLLNYKQPVRVEVK